MEFLELYNQINKKAQREFPDVALHTLFQQQYKETPNAIATLDCQKQLTYAQLDEKSDQLATWLNSKGIGRADLVGLCCDRDTDTPALLLGIMKSGAGYVPLDPDDPVDRLIYMVENSEVKHLVATADNCI